MALSTPVERRFRVVALALTLPAAAMLLLAVMHLRGALRSRTALARAAQETVRHRLAEMLDVLYVGMFRGVVDPWASAHALLSAQKLRSRAPEPARMLQLIVHDYDSLARCRCGSLLPARGILVYRARDSVLAYRGSLPEAQVRARMQRLAQRLEDRTPKRMTLVADSDAAGPFLVVYAWGSGTGSGDLLTGFDTDLDSFSRGWIAELHARAADSLFGSRDSLSSIGVRVTHPSGSVLYEAGDMHGVSASLTTFGNGLRLGGGVGTQPLTTTMSYGPAAVARVIPGGLPRSPWPLAVAAACLAVLLAALSLVLLWRLREVLAVREQFVSGVSHELRTPLTLIIMYADSLLLERPTPATRRRAAGVIAREARRLITLVENALQFVRGQRSEIALNLAPHDLGSLVSLVVEDLAPLAGERSAELRCDLEPGVSGVVDAGGFRQIVVNLLDNALRFGPLGQVVTIRLFRQGESALLTIDDQGPGVPPEAQRLIWAPFYRHAATRDTTVAGAGLGLALARQLTELFGGAISVEDAPGGGARFVLRLPIQRREAPAPGLAHSA
jgi:signal transduction histidine kinase